MRGVGYGQTESSAASTTSLTRRKSNLPSSLAGTSAIQPFVKQVKRPTQPTEQSNAMMLSIGNKLKEQLKN